MHWFTLLLVCSVVAGVVSGAEKHITLKAKQQTRLMHESGDGTVESSWTIEACEGCKLITSCYVYSRSCDDHLLTIDDGQKVATYCKPRFSSTVYAYSLYNKMDISIKTMGPSNGSFCHVSATKPYMNTKYEEIDSSEHGLGKNAQRQTSCKCGWTNKNPARIVGGQETSVNEFPFAAILKIKHDKKPLCGGSIITAYHVLTAAHCTKPFQNIPFVVVIGEHDYSRTDDTPHTKEIDVRATYEHASYDDFSSVYDIAIALLAEKIEYNDFVGPVCLPNTRLDLIGEYIKVIGWGRTATKGPSSSVLRKVNLRALEIGICREMYNKVEIKDPYQICTWAPDRDSCKGDSGGPLVWNDPETNRLVQVALVSYGRECGSTDPAVNTEVAYFMDWIKQIIADTVPEEVCV